MFVDLTIKHRTYHQEYVRRHVNPPEPLEPRQGLRRALGNRLIHIGQRLAETDRTQTIGRAA